MISQPRRWGITGEEACRYIETLTCSKGPNAGEPLRLLPYQREYIEALIDRRPLVKRSGIWIPRKAGKSELCAAIGTMVFDLVAPMNGRILVSGPTATEAGELYDTIVAMLTAKYPEQFDPWSQEKPERRRYNNNLSHHILRDLKTGTVLRALSGTSPGHGWNPVIAICDEIHKWDQPKHRRFWDGMRTQFGAQPEGLLLTLTTVGHHEPESIEQQEFEHAFNVYQDPSHDEHYLPLIFAAPMEADWKDEEVWKQAQPSLGHHCSMDYYREMCVLAERQESFTNEFRRLYLNQRTQTITRWLNVEAWNKCKGSPTIAGGAGGLDLSSKEDLTSFAIVTPDNHIACWNWIPEQKAMAYEQSHKIPYGRWEAEGLVTFHRGKRIDQERVIADVIEHCATAGVDRIGVDPWSCSAWHRHFEDAGIEIVEISQTYSGMSEATKELASLINSHEITHDGNELLAWCVGHAQKQEHHSHIRPVKPSQGEKKIDPLCAVVNALKLVMIEEVDTGVYVA